MVRVSGPKTQIRKSVTVRSATPELSLSTFGADSKQTMDRLEKSQRVRSAIMNAERPSNILYRTTGQTSYWYMYALMDWYVSEVSVLSTIILRSTSELFRHGLDFHPRFAFKCVDCGYESQTTITKCPECGSLHLRKPDMSQQKYFVRPNGKSFIDEANDNGEPLKDVLKGYAEMQYRNNQAYLLCNTGEFVDPEDMSLQRAYPMEFLAQDPKFVMGLFDETGKFGTKYAFTRDDRGTCISMDEDPDALNDYDDEGRTLYPAAWRVGSSYGGTGEVRHYTQEEIYQDHWFRPALTYGIPIWFDIEDDLLAYHFIEKHFLNRFMYGIVRKMLFLPGFNDEDVEDLVKGIQNVLATNDNSIPIVCTPPQAPGVAEQKPQALELGTDDASQIMMAKNDIRDRICAHAGVPNIFAGDAEASGGMNNESQQITIFDRYLMEKYNSIDRLCEWVLSWFPQITDWELTVSRPSKAYTDTKRRLDKIQEAQLMKSLGFDIQFINGEFRYSEEPIDQIQRKEQEAMMKQQQQMAVMEGGMLPGDGDGPPEKGTARREDPEIGDSKDEIDLSKREADDAMSE